MIERTSFLAACVALIACAGAAADDAFTVSDEQLGRLGVQLGTAQPVERMEVAAAPAKVVVPNGRQALVSAPLAGVVARLAVAEGDRVEAGQLVAELDSTEYLALQRDYVDAAAAAELAAAQEERDRALLEEGIIAERRFAETAAAARLAKARVEQARAQLALAGWAASDFARLREDGRLSARVALRAPFAGVVATSTAEVGARVDALGPVLTLADLRELWLELRLRQEDAASVDERMQVVVATPAGTFTGSVTTVGRVVDPDTQTVLVRAAFDNSTGALRAGQFVQAHVLASSPGGRALAVPASAVTRSGADALLFERQGNEIRVRRVDVLAESGDQVFVANDLGPEARIAVDGISALKALWFASGEGG
jgi:membrane fusion protein, heavy metal efflux system